MLYGNIFTFLFIFFLYLFAINEKIVAQSHKTILEKSHKIEYLLPEPFGEDNIPEKVYFRIEADLTEIEEQNLKKLFFFALNKAGRNGNMTKHSNVYTITFFSGKFDDVMSNVMNFYKKSNGDFIIGSKQFLHDIDKYLKFYDTQKMIVNPCFISYTRFWNGTLMNPIIIFFDNKKDVMSQSISKINCAGNAIFDIFGIIGRDKIFSTDTIFLNDNLEIYISD